MDPSQAIGTGGNGIMSSQSTDASPVESSAAGSSIDDSKENLNQVINSIQKNLGILHQLYLTVSSFNVASQLPLLQRILIDDGKNPDEFTRDVLNGCISKNQITKGKTDAFKGLRKHLLEELEQAFPDEVEAYREIRAASAVVRPWIQDLETRDVSQICESMESKRLAQAQSMLPNGDVKLKPEI
ncbi:hypothetical protein RD792_009245 [Penstemon davidsonii]|uniref:Mediator of RNA polymerase II transcription subunit 10 n=1 Tax=Penstemon davidsonii TaxID=160366 RepID=A0ABR0DBG8_9LAMI|nr:hypothetical protein RD792_009245 [Penstemon davidsonii]